MNKAIKLLFLSLFLGDSGCAKSHEAPRISDPDTEATLPAEMLPVSGNKVFFGTSLATLPDVRTRFLETIDAWVSAYPMPGVQFYVFQYTRSPHSYRVPGEGLIRFGWWQGNMGYTVGDCSWEIPRYFYGVDDPPPLGSGPVNLPPDDVMRRSKALALVPK